MKNSIEQEAGLPKGYVAVVATLPIWGELISIGICMALAKGNAGLAWEYHDNKLWFLLYAFISGILCMLDADRLKKLNVELSYLWGIILVPVYLILRGVRVSKVKGGGIIKNNLYIIVWIVSFFGSAFMTALIEDRYSSEPSPEVQAESVRVAGNDGKLEMGSPPTGTWSTDSGDLVHQISQNSYKTTVQGETKECKWLESLPPDRASIQGCAALFDSKIKSGAEIRSDYLSRLASEGIKDPELGQMQKEISKLKDGSYQEIGLVYSDGPAECGHYIYLNKAVLVHIVDCLLTGNSIMVNVLSSK